MTEIMHIGLSGWIIQDGNYGDFQCGRRYSFALEFWPSTKLTPREPDRVPVTVLKWLRDCTYAVEATIIHARENWWVLDAGLLLYCEARPPAPAGTRLAGEITIGIDPFFYLESHSCEPDAPALIYEWLIEGIDLDTTPLIEVRPRTFARDAARRSAKPIERTNAWSDKPGPPEYLLSCRRLPGEPRR